MANGNSLKMPKTNTPISVFIILALLMGGSVVFLSSLIGFWGLVIALVVFGFSVESYTETVPGYYARIVINHLNSTQRTIFQGLHPKLPWESVTRDLDLRVDLKDVLSETYTSLDTLMETKYVYTMRPELDGEAIILYASYETDALKQSIRALLSMLLSDYYGRHNGAQLLDKRRINKEVFDIEPGRPLDEKSGRDLIQEFQHAHGVIVTVRLEDSDFDAATQAARDTKSRAKSLKEAVDLLMEVGPDGSGMSRADAEKRAAQMQLPNLQENIITLKAEGLENLRDVTLLPPGTIGGGKGGKK